MLLKIFRAISFPFFGIYDFLYILRFGVRPIGEGIFSVERKPRKYPGANLELPDGTRIKKDDQVLFLHLTKKVLKSLTGDSKRLTRSRIHNILESSLKGLAEFSLRNNRQFNAFCGKTSLFIPLVKRYGFTIIPLDGKISHLEASLQSFFLRNRKSLRAKRFYYYLASRRSAEQRFTTNR